MKTKVECLRALASTYSAPHHTSSNSSHFWFSECTIWKILSLVGSHTTLSYFLGREFRLMCAHNKWRISGSKQEIGFLGIFYLSKNGLWNRDFFHFTKKGISPQHDPKPETQVPDPSLACTNLLQHFIAHTYRIVASL